MFLGGSLACAASGLPRAEPTTHPAARSNPEWRHFELENGLRVHALANDTGYVSVSLLLRAQQITFEDGGLAHIMEHTSFTGAAGDLSAADLKELYKDIVQDSNASTRAGAIEWQISFLPERLEEALHILSVTSLDQKFDEETVASEAKIVLQELYLDKYGKTEDCQKRFNRALYGKDHPYAWDTVEKEIATAKTPPAKLASRLRRYAAGVKLPANMDLFLAGGFEPDAVQNALRTSFGRFPYAKAPMLDFPPVAANRSYEKLVGPSHDLSRPMCRLVIAWNTGVRVGDPEARVLAALREYLSGVLFLQLREKLGEAYSPEVDYEPDSCSGVFTITVTSSIGTTKLERSVFDAMELTKQKIDQREVARFRSRTRLERLKDEGDNAVLVMRQLESVEYGASPRDLPVETVTADEILFAAQRYLPSYKGSYVRLALRGD